MYNHTIKASVLIIEERLSSPVLLLTSSGFKQGSESMVTTAQVLIMDGWVNREHVWACEEHEKGSRMYATQCSCLLSALLWEERLGTACARYSA